MSKRGDPWEVPLLRAIVLLDGTKLDTLDQARAYIIALPEKRHSAQWNAAVRQLMAAAESGAAIDVHRATIALAFLYEGKINQNA